MFAQNEVLHKPEGFNTLSIIATVVPASQTIKTDSDSVRQASTTSGTIFDISLPGSSFPSGWVLLQSMLIRFGGDYDARLYYDLGRGFADNSYFEIPASEKGVINELVCIPEGVRQMKFSLMGNAGEFELGEFRFIKVSSVKRRWLMAKRLMSVLQQENRRRMFFKRFGFLWTLTDLYGAYKSAGKLLPHAAAPPYQEWITQFDSLNAQDHAQITSHISRFVSNPDFYILMIADSADSDAVNKTLASLEMQLYREFRCAVLEVSGRNKQDSYIGSSMQAGVSYVGCGNAEEWLQKFNDSLEGKHAQRWVMVVCAGDVLPPQALYQFACSILACPEAAILYSDDDFIDMKGQRSKPRFKPDWSLTHYQSTDYLGNAVAIRGHVAAKAGGVTMDYCLHGNYDFLLRVIDLIRGDGKGKVVHIPAVLLHQSEFLNFDADRKNSTVGVGVEAVKRHLSRNGVIADVLVTYPGCKQIKYQLPTEPPLVSIAIPARDMMEITQRCLESILNKTTYSRFEIIVVDNRSESSEMKEFLEGIAALENVRVLSYDAPFNFSAINNFAVSEAKGEVICMLNNDTEVMSPNWLEELVGNLLQTSVGAVGAKLYFSENVYGR